MSRLLYNGKECQNSINDSVTATNTVWSSSKTNEQIAKVIDDSTVSSSESTWSTTKIHDEYYSTVNTTQMKGAIDSHTPVANGGLGIVDAVKMTQSQYDALSTYDENRIYVITD